MSKVNQNKQKIKQLSKTTGYSIENGFKQIGIYVDNLMANQFGYLLLYQTALFNQENFGASFSVFARDKLPPCLIPTIPIFNARDIVGFDGNIIATSIKNVKELSRATRAKKFFYIFDLEWKQKDVIISRIDVQSILKDPNIIKFTRSKEYYDCIKDECENLSQTLVPNCEPNLILEIVNESEHNESS